MNSTSNNHFDKDDDRCKIIIKCGSLGSITIPDETPAGATFNVTSLTLDTSSLKNPCIKLEFASHVITDSFTGVISLQIFKLCKGQFLPIQVGPQWLFSRPNSSSENTDFSFFVCDCCNTCFDECCTYTVVATVVGAPTEDNIHFTNATLAALAVEDEKACC